MEAEESRDDEGPYFAYLPPEDRLWRHPSEIGASTARAMAAIRTVSGGRLWTVALVAGVLGAVLASGVGLATGLFQRHTVVVGFPVQAPRTTDVAESSAFASPGWPTIENDLAPSLVAVLSPGQVASGIVFTAAGDSTYLITAADAVSGLDRITAVFDDGTRQRAHLVGSDPATGIAVLRVEGTGHTVPTFGSAMGLQVADDVLVVGAPGSGSTAVGPGALSSLDTDLHSGAGYTLHGMMAVSDVTVPAAANGGALANQGGEIVGLATDLASVDAGMQGMGFAVPIDTAEHVATQLLEGHHPAHPWIGVESATDLSSMTANQLGVPGGAQVGAVAGGSPAARAGLEPGDIVTAYAGHWVKSSGALVAMLSWSRPDTRTTISYLDEGHLRRETITVGTLPGG